jgi:hypothetical protein
MRPNRGWRAIECVCPLLTNPFDLPRQRSLLSPRAPKLDNQRMEAKGPEGARAHVPDRLTNEPSQPDQPSDAIYPKNSPWKSVWLDQASKRPTFLKPELAVRGCVAAE